MEAIGYRKKDKFKKRLPRFFQYLVLSIVVLIVVVPIVILVFGALKNPRRDVFPPVHTTKSGALGKPYQNPY